MAGQSQVHDHLLRFFKSVTWFMLVMNKIKLLIKYSNCKCFFLFSFQSKEDQTQVVTNLKTISMSSSKLLLAAKALSTDPNSPNLKNQLAAAARLEPRTLFLLVPSLCNHLFYVL